MPSLSPTMTEARIFRSIQNHVDSGNKVVSLTKCLCIDMQGNIARWLKKEGDKIAPGEVLCEVETVGSLLLSPCSYSLVDQ